MVKLVGAVRNFHENIKYIQIDVEDGTGLVRVILWRKEKECTAQHQMIHECNSNCYIRVCVCSGPSVMMGVTVKHALTSTSSPPNDIPSIPWSPVVLPLWTPWGAC